MDARPHSMYPPIDFGRVVGLVGLAAADLAAWVAIVRYPLVALGALAITVIAAWDGVSDRVRRLIPL